MLSPAPKPRGRRGASLFPAGDERRRSRCAGFVDFFRAVSWLPLSRDGLHFSPAALFSILKKKARLPRQTRLPSRGKMTQFILFFFLYMCYTEKGMYAPEGEGAFF